MQVTRIGLDIAKNVFQVHGVDEHGKVVIRKQLSRSKVLTYFAQLPVCRIGIEACGSAHEWGRELQKLGHDVRLMACSSLSPTAQNRRMIAMTPRRSVKPSRARRCGLSPSRRSNNRLC